MKKKEESEERASALQKAVYEAPKATFIAVKKEERLTTCGDSETLCTTTYHP
ncbi:MAG: hypothetical protein ABFD80_12135 [Acidobacteriota bacterium]